MDTFGDLPPTKEIVDPNEDQEEVDTTFYPHFKSELFLNLVYDATSYKHPGGIP